MKPSKITVLSAASTLAALGIIATLHAIDWVNYKLSGKTL